jgi:hypothetical protein
MSRTGRGEASPGPAIIESAPTLPLSGYSAISGRFFVEIER